MTRGLVERPVSATVVEISVASCLFGVVTPWILAKYFGHRWMTHELGISLKKAS